MGISQARRVQWVELFDNERQWTEDSTRCSSFTHHVLEDWNNHNEDLTFFLVLIHESRLHLIPFQRAMVFKEWWFYFTFFLLQLLHFPCPQPLLPHPTPTFPPSWWTHMCNYALLCRCFWRTGFDVGIPSSVGAPPYSLRPTLNMKHAVLPWLAVRQVSRIYLSLTPSFVLPHWPFLWV